MQWGFGGAERCAIDFFRIELKSDHNQSKAAHASTQRAEGRGRWCSRGA
jgi:hypothetical protein